MQFSTICAVCSPALWHIQAGDGNWTISKCRNEVGTSREFNKLLEVQKKTTSWTPARQWPHTGMCAEHTWEKMELRISHQQNHCQDWECVRNRGPTDLYLHNEAKIEHHCKERLLSFLTVVNWTYCTVYHKSPKSPINISKTSCKSEGLQTSPDLTDPVCILLA